MDSGGQNHVGTFLNLAGLEHRLRFGTTFVDVLCPPALKHYKNKGFTAHRPRPAKSPAANQKHRQLRKLPVRAKHLEKDLYNS